MLANVYPEAVVQARQARMSRQTLWYFAELDAFSSPECAYELRAYGLQRVM